MTSIPQELATALEHHRAGRLQEAEKIYRQVLAVDPQHPDALHCLGIVAHQVGRNEVALELVTQAIQVRGTEAGYHSTLGEVYQAQDRIPQAIACYKRALQLKPDFAKGYLNLGLILHYQGQLKEALSCFERALQLKPDSADAHLDRSMHRLLTGDFARGWPEFEWRWQTKGFPPRVFSQPLWDGQPLPMGTLLLHAEQGLGDTLQFCRYATLAKERAAKILMECQRPLLPLLQGCPGIDQLFGQGEPLPPFDAHAPLLSLPGILKTTLQTIPASVPYLGAITALVETWRQRLSQIKGFKIGIHWQGNTGHRYDRYRSIPLPHFASLAAVPGVSLISLQKGAGREQLAGARTRFPVMDLGEELDQGVGAFLDTAAVLKNLDLVVATDSAIAHLAGALGVPVWLALPLVPDWRWLLEREDSPWYPTMRLFRQKHFGDWTGVFQRIAAALAPHPGRIQKGGKAEPKRIARGRPVLVNGPVRLKGCRHGPMLYLVTDQYIGQSLDRYGEFSEGEQELFRRLVQPGWTIVEIGANMGAHTIPLARAVGFRGTVHAFEPQRVLFQFLCANIALNALGHVHAHQVALGRQVGTLVVPRLNYSVAQNFGGLELGRWQDGEPVPAATVDTLNLPACHFLKVDVEGMEEDVLVGAEHTIRRCQPLLYVENDREDKSADLIRYLLGLGYRLFWHVPALFNPRNYFGVAENIFGKIVSVNMLGLPAPAVQDTPGLREITSPEDSWKTLLE